MTTKNLPLRIVWAEGLGIFLIILFLWLDELLDLPHYLFAAPATPINWVESLFESAIILLLGSILLTFSFRQARRLQLLTREKDQLLGLISHDLRSPFTSLLLNAELLRDALEAQKNTELHSLAADLHQAGQHCYQQLDDLLKWVQLQFGHLQLIPEPCDCHMVIEELLGELEIDLATKTINCQNRVPAKLTVMLDPMVLKSALRNLLSNAIKFSHIGGRIEISAIPVEDEVDIAVRDFGVGMSEEICRHLFLSDGGLSQKGTAGEKGCGLGLLLARRLIELSGSELQVESQPGAGAFFHFRAPAPDR